jgi:hypothetical protein
LDTAVHIPTYEVAEVILFKSREVVPFMDSTGQKMLLKAMHNV